MPTKKTKPRRPKREPFDDSRRHTERFTLRVAPQLAARLRARAEAHAITIAQVVSDALDALEGRSA